MEKYGRRPGRYQFDIEAYVVSRLAATGIGRIEALGLDTYADEGLLTRAQQLQGYFAEQLHSLRNEPNVIDIRNYGLVGGVELASIPGEPTKRAFGV